MSAHNHVILQEVLRQVGDWREPDPVTGLQRGDWLLLGDKPTKHRPLSWPLQSSDGNAFVIWERWGVLTAGPIDAEGLAGNKSPNFLPLTEGQESFWAKYPAPTQSRGLAATKGEAETPPHAGAATNCKAECDYLTGRTSKAQTMWGLRNPEDGPGALGLPSHLSLWAWNWASRLLLWCGKSTERKRCGAGLWGLLAVEQEPWEETFGMEGPSLSPKQKQISARNWSPCAPGCICMYICVSVCILLT